MRWSGRRESGNVEDRRGRGGMAVGGGIVGVIVLVVALLLGKNPQELLNLVPGTMQEQTAKFILTFHFMMNFANVSALPAISHKPTLLLMKLGTMSKTCWEYLIK